MWPWGHLAVGYLVYSLYAHVRYERPPSGYATVLVALGTQFPDLVDKPLAWTFGVLPTGRSLAHSLFTFLVVLLVVRRYARSVDRPELGTAFIVGYLTHPFADGVSALLAREFAYLTYLVWPLLPLPAYDTETSFLAHFTELSLTSGVLVEIGFAGFVVLLWVYDGVPGLRELYAMPGRIYDRVTSARSH